MISHYHADVTQSTCLQACDSLEEHWPSSNLAYLANARANAGTGEHQSINQSLAISNLAEDEKANVRAVHYLHLQ